jgi:hypothetical protein
MPNEQLSYADRDELAELRRLRTELADVETHRRMLLGRRRFVLRRLRRRGVPIEELGSATGLTRQTVHRLVRDN